MAHWDGSRVIEWPTHRAKDYPGWLVVDCGCCAGIEWGGDNPQECDSCWGTGLRYIHEATRTVAVYPGGPLLGAKASDYEMARVLASLAEVDA
jgi:hypothetical protein